VLSGTTTEKALRDAVQNAGISVDVVLVKTHGEGLAMLDDGKISTYFADLSILGSLIKRAFGASAKPDQVLRTLYFVSGLPD
jgi:ABC-type amino acid transport substrate-binding protein